MPNSDPHAQIARKIHSIEVAKIGLVEQIADVFRGIQSGNERDLAQSLGELIALAYYLGWQMDVPLQAIEQEARNSLPKALSRDSADPADIEFIQRYLQSKR
ncbi:MAG: hypothetical protein IRZ33_01115 [Alicyclobacillaceae bacterium]|nr:hypothetical protein [Alicyclobacillaceae bacterium]